MTEKFEIDDTDLAVIGELRRNGRATNQQIADRLNITAATVSARIRRLEKSEKMRVVAVSDFKAHGYDVLLEIAIEVDNRPASQVAEQLAKLDEVFAVHLVTGRYDIDALIVLRDFSELQEFLRNKLSVIKGIRSMVPAITVDVVKYKFDVAPLTPRENKPVRLQRQSAGPSRANGLDELDQNLIDTLSHDARLSNRKIANDLGVTEGTVRGRIKKLQQDRLIAFTAVMSPDLLNQSQLAFIGILADPDKVEDLAKRISELHGITGVLVTLGRFNIFAICLYNQLEELHATASETILAMPGVHHVETSIAVKTVKYDSRIVRITANDHPLED